MDYKSPIKAIYSDVQLKFEDGVYKAVQAVDIHIDRDELIKALQYDRQQYEKGWHDALLKVQEPVEPTEPDEANTTYCGACGSAVGYEAIEPSGMDYVRYNYCPSCGKMVKWE